MESKAFYQIFKSYSIENTPYFSLIKQLTGDLIKFSQILLDKKTHDIPELIGFLFENQITIDLDKLDTNELKWLILGILLTVKIFEKKKKHIKINDLYQLQKRIKKECKWHQSNSFIKLFNLKNTINDEKFHYYFLILISNIRNQYINTSRSNNTSSYQINSLQIATLQNQFKTIPIIQSKIILNPKFDNTIHYSLTHLLKYILISMIILITSYIFINY